MQTEPRSFLSLFFRLGGWLALIPLPMALIAAAIWTAADGNDRQDGLEHQLATVMEKQDGNRVLLATQYDGEVVRIRLRLPEDRWRALETDREIGIAFPPGDPWSARIETRQGLSSLQALPHLLGILSAAVMTLWFLRRAVRQAGGAIIARERGDMRQARVTALVDTGVKVNNRSQYRITWRDEGGTDGRSFMAARSAFGDLGPGSTITVYAPPRGKGPSWWEGDVGPRQGSAPRRMSAPERPPRKAPKRAAPAVGSGATEAAALVFAAAEAIKAVDAAAGTTAAEQGVPADVSTPRGRGKSRRKPSAPVSPTAGAIHRRGGTAGRSVQGRRWGDGPSIRR